VSQCTGRGSLSGDHCCWVHGKECEHLRRDVPGRNFACGLLLKHGGDWERVYTDPEYPRFLLSSGILCGDWKPSARQCCRDGE
jgi:hypothetical protein